MGNGVGDADAAEVVAGEVELGELGEGGGDGGLEGAVIEGVLGDGAGMAGEVQALGVAR